MATWEEDDEATNHQRYRKLQVTYITTSVVVSITSLEIKVAWCDLVRKQVGHSRDTAELSRVGGGLGTCRVSSKWPTGRSWQEGIRIRYVMAEIRGMNSILRESKQCYAIDFGIWFLIGWWKLLIMPIHFRSSFNAEDPNLVEGGLILYSISSEIYDVLENV